jgi:hypothetical protein
MFIGIVLLLIFGAILLAVLGSGPGKPSKPVTPLLKPAKADPEPTGVEAFGPWLERRRIDHEDEKRKEEDRRNHLIAMWTQTEPSVMQAIELVNAKLIQHSAMRLEAMAEHKFYGHEDSSYGIQYWLTGARGMPSISFRVTEDNLYVAYVEIPLDRLTIEAIADALADEVKSAIEG